jgi:ABC-type lipoprotein release transport system permease subunit
VQHQIQAILGDKFIVKTRYEQREAFYKLVKTEKLISYIIILFILIIAIFNTIGTLYLLVMEKVKEIKILHSIGLTAPKIANIFAWQSIFIAAVGGIIGILIGFIICLIQQQFGLIKVNSGSSLAYPIRFALVDAVIVFVTILMLGVITSIYPWLKARKIAIGVM